MSEQWKPGDTAWVWDKEQLTYVELIQFDLPCWWVVRKEFGRCTGSLSESELFRTADKCWLARIDNLGRKAAEASNELYATEDAYAAWQAQQGKERI